VRETKQCTLDVINTHRGWGACWKQHQLELLGSWNQPQVGTHSKTHHPNAATTTTTTTDHTVVQLDACK